jgi:hypothetical protein
MICVAGFPGGAIPVEQSHPGIRSAKVLSKQSVKRQVGSKQQNTIEKL